MNKHIDIFSKEYLTEEERKYPLVRREEYFTFSTTSDLSPEVIVTTSLDFMKKMYNSPIEIERRTFTHRLIQDTASFMVHWTIFFHKRLNGFSGTDTIKWNLKMDE